MHIKWKRIFGLALVFIGYILSPLSWWNDLFINIPIAYFLAWLSSLLNKSIFTYAFVGAYWLTNVVGLMLMHRGAHYVVTKNKECKYCKKEFIEDILIAVAYSALILILVKLGILKPLNEYIADIKKMLDYYN